MTQDALQKGIRAARRGKAEPARHLLGQIVQQEPDNEEAWLWLSRVAETPSQQAEYLNQVLRINPDNRWAAEQLAQLQTPTAGEPPPLSQTDQRPPAPDAGQPPPLPLVDQPPTAPGPAPAKKEAPANRRKYERLQKKHAAQDYAADMIKCPNCGGPIEVQGGKAVKTFVCSACGSVLDLSQEQAAVLGSTNQQIKPRKPIEPGMEGAFNGEKHQVIGWLRYEGWDDEDKWRWDEWLLLSGSGKYRWLSYDSESGFLLQEKVTLTQPFNPVRDDTIAVPGGAARITERNPARIIALKGELTWRAAVGEQINYLEARRGNVRYSIEYSKESIEIVAGEPISDEAVWTAFGRGDLVKKAQTGSQMNKAFALLTAVAAILAMISCAGAIFAGLTGEELAQQTVQLSKGESSVLIGPVEITAPERVHRVSMALSSLPTNSWAVVEVSIIDNAGNEHFLFFEEFWDEVGSDSDGAWHESDLSGNELFKPDSAGPYSFELSMNEATVSSVNVTATIDQGVWLGRYFIIFGVFSLVLAAIFYGLSRR